jgi:pilus assembly protein Flp/PilA
MLTLYTNISARLHRDEKGATAVEYGIMVALIAVLIIAAVALLGEGMRDAFTQIQCGINGGTYAAGTTGAGGGTCTGGRQ